MTLQSKGTCGRMICKRVSQEAPLFLHMPYSMSATQHTTLVDRNHHSQAVSLCPFLQERGVAEGV